MLGQLSRRGDKKEEEEDLTCLFVEKKIVLYSKCRMVLERTFSTYVELFMVMQVEKQIR